MRYLTLCCDYDGTLAHNGKVSDATLAALERVLESGRRLVLVTGRELDDLQAAFPQLELFERVVAENGALLYRPASREEKLLAERPPDRFIDLLNERGVGPMSVGRVIVATWEPHEVTVLEAIRDLELELQVIFNKGAVMVLPAGVNKATGLAAALEEMGLSAHNAIGIGDAENDHAFLSFCECSVAVANALPMVKETADFVTGGDHGAGVIELIDELLADDLAGREDRLTRHHILLGTDADGREVHVRPYGSNLLVVGTSGSGKSTVATGLLERLAEREYTFCVIDPEGDYEEFESAVPLGTPERAPGLDEVLQLLSKPGQNAVVNLVGLPIADRPSFFLALLPRLQELRARTGRPHWLVVDETHHLLPAAWEPAYLTLPEKLNGLVCITVHPNLIATAALEGIDTIVALGAHPEVMLREFSEKVGEPAPLTEAVALEPSEALVWLPEEGRSPFRLRIAPSRTERRRHSRKYAEGELGPDRSFYFRGAEGKLNLRAQNLILFLQLADGVDDETWVYHLRQGDYSRWLEDCVKDETLAEEARRVEALAEVSPQESRDLIRKVIEEHYTLPAPTSTSIAGTDAAAP
jgi:hydroxymethylpyrimidine pyrophosphatase-like HAD family hydrolase